MALTRNYKETIMERVKTDPEYANAIFEQGVKAILDGDIAVGKSIVCDYTNATIEGLLTGKGDQT